MSEWEIIGPAPSNQDSEWEIIGPAPSVEPEVPWHQGRILSGVTGFNKGVEDITHGVLQPLLESGYLGENIKRGSEQVAQRRQQGYNESLERNPGSTLLGNVLGGTAVSLPAASLAGGGAALSRAPGYLKYLQSILGSGASGALSGGATYVNPNESRLENALYGGALGGVLGGVGSAIGAGRNAVSAVKKAYPAKKVANEILSTISDVENKYKGDYKNLFKEAKDLGIKLQVPKIKEKPIIEEMTRKESKYLRNFIDPQNSKFGNPKYAHNAASDLGKMIRRLDKKKDGIVGLNSSERKALESARQAQKNIRSSIGEGFESSGRKDLASKYSEITSGFGKDVIPYRTTAAINKYERGELSDNEFLKALLSDKRFQAQKGAFHPELKTRKIAPLVAGGAISAYPILKGASSLFNLLGNE